MGKRVIIEDIIPAQQLREVVCYNEWERAQEFQSQRRRDEWLSWRACLRREVGREIQIDYNTLGAPYIVGHNLHIGVSHTRNRIGIIISTEPCAIDIELLSRNFEGISSRYISAAEKSVIEALNAPASLAIAWCAKEAAYKYAAGRAVDFINDITIESLDTNSQTLKIKILGLTTVAEYITTEDYVAVTIG